MSAGQITVEMLQEARYGIERHDARRRQAAHDVAGMVRPHLDQPLPVLIAARELAAATVGDSGDWCATPRLVRIYREGK